MQTLPDKGRLILTSVIVGFLANATTGFSYELLNEYSHEEIRQTVCFVENLESRVIEKTKEIKKEIKDSKSTRTLTTEDYVKKFFADTPVMVDIARCESSFRHFNDSGSVLRGVVNNSDVGVMQINKYYHEARATELGLDLHSKDGNMMYAMYLYEKEGTSPWSASQSCWDSSREDCPTLKRQSRERKRVTKILNSDKTKIQAKTLALSG